MKVDIRFPIGLMFTVIGLIVTVFGAISDRQIYNRSLGININLWWGLVLLAFGVAMLLSAWIVARSDGKSSGKDAKNR